MFTILIDGAYFLLAVMVKGDESSRLTSRGFWPHIDSQVFSRWQWEPKANTFLNDASQPKMRASRFLYALTLTNLYR